VIQVTRLAINYRQRFKQDVVIDMYCYEDAATTKGRAPIYAASHVLAHRQEADGA